MSRLGVLVGGLVRASIMARVVRKDNARKVSDYEILANEPTNKKPS